MPTLEAIQAAITTDSQPEPSPSLTEPSVSSPAAEPAAATTEPTEPAESTADPAAEPAISPTPDAPDEFITWLLETQPENADEIKTFKTGEDFVKSSFEKSKLIGKRNEDAALVQRMREAGVTDADIAEVLDRKNGRTQTPEPSRKDGPEVEYDPKWITFNDKGEPILTAEGRRVPNVESKIAAYRAKMNEAMWNPAVMAELVGKYIKSDDGDVTAALNEIKNKEFVRTQQDWIKENSQHIYADPATRSFTPLGEKIDSLLKDQGFYPNLVNDFKQRAEKAKEYSIAMLKPTPVKRTVPVPAKHQTPIGGGDKVKLTLEQFKKKYPNYSFGEFADFTEKGIEPKR